MSEIHRFMSSFRYGFRPHAFKIEILGVSNKLEFMCMSSNVPGREIGTIEVPVGNMQVPIPGDPPAVEWTTNCMLDTDFSIYDDVENWFDMIHHPETLIGADLSILLRTANIILLDNNHKEIKEYQLLNLWPKTLGELEISKESRDEIARFDVTWAFSTRLRVR